jgi:hypothetical protein
MLLVSPLGILAHHGFAGYAMAADVEFPAEVETFEFSNPHGLIHFKTRDAKGKIQDWTAETAAPVILIRAGWDKTILPAGAHVTIIGHAAKNGSHSMILQKLILDNGKELNNFIPQ